MDDYFKSAGTSLGELARAADIDPDRFRETDFGLTTQQVDRLMAEALRLTGRSDIGFEWGCRLKLNPHDILGYAMLSCPTLGPVAAPVFPLLQASDAHVQNELPSAHRSPRGDRLPAGAANGHRKRCS
ncbi:AraC family transcriptional regulator ligand-binding domain-containing protein [Cupriavidus basilensis]